MAGGLRYLLELFLRGDYPPERAIAADNVDRQYNVYYFDIDKPTSSFWIDWGGNFDDLPDTTNVQIIMDEFLQYMDSLADCKITEKSYCVVGTKIYMNLPRAPWQYSTVNTEIEAVKGFSSAPKSADNPSDDEYSGTRYPARLQVPSVKNKLSDPVSGTALYQTWSATLDNSDGEFDDTDENNFFNVPARLLKSNIENPERPDFSTIRYGLVDDQQTTDKTFKVTSADILRSLTSEVCETFTTTEFANLPDNLGGKRKRKIWGSVDGVKLSKIDSTDDSKFYAGDQVTAVSAVYDSEGNSLAFSFASATGIITEATEEADHADVTGSTDNRIGEIIRDVLSDIGGITFIASYWDTIEAVVYINSSPQIGFTFSGGTIKKLITDVLKNDFAYLIQKNSGKLTLREWGQEYTTHNIESWQITGYPKKNHTDGKNNFMSSARIDYDKDESSGAYQKSYFYDDEQSTIREIYRKEQTGEFKLQLTSDSDVEDFAELAIERFGRIPETISLPLGYDTSQIELLDLIQIPISFNGRIFSKKLAWIVKELNTAQDVAGLEAATYYKIYYTGGRASYNRTQGAVSISGSGIPAYVDASGVKAAQIPYTQSRGIGTPQADAAGDYAASVPGVFRRVQS